MLRSARSWENSCQRLHPPLLQYRGISVVATKASLTYGCRSCAIVVLAPSVRARVPNRKPLVPPRRSGEQLNNTKKDYFLNDISLQNVDDHGTPENYFYLSSVNSGDFLEYMI